MRSGDFWAGGGCGHGRLQWKRAREGKEEHSRKDYTIIILGRSIRSVNEGSQGFDGPIKTCFQ